MVLLVPPVRPTAHREPERELVAPLALRVVVHQAKHDPVRLVRVRQVLPGERETEQSLVLQRLRRSERGGDGFVDLL